MPDLDPSTWFGSYFNWPRFSESEDPDFEPGDELVGCGCFVVGVLLLGLILIYFFYLWVVI